MSVVMDRGMPRQKITVDEYYRMAEVGLLSPDARVELIEGEIIDMPPIGTVHASAVTYIQCELYAALARRAHIRAQNPLRLSSYSELQPDILLASLREDGYWHKHPDPADTILVIEVSNSSLAKDRTGKARLYAAHGVPELWIVDVRNSRVEIYRDPQKNSYQSVCIIEEATPLTIQLIPDVELNLPELFDEH